jgi:hypothetical protein
MTQKMFEVTRLRELDGLPQVCLGNGVVIPPEALVATTRDNVMNSRIELWKQLTVKNSRSISSYRVRMLNSSAL